MYLNGTCFFACAWMAAALAVIMRHINSSTQLGGGGGEPHRTVYHRFLGGVKRGGGGGGRKGRGGVVSDWGEAALPDRVPLHQRGWGRGAHPFSLGFCRVTALHLKTFPEPCRASRRDKGALLCVQFVRCSKMALQSHFEGFSAGFKCSSGERKKKKIQKGGKKERRPPSPINYLWGWSSAGWCNRCI